MSLIVFFVSVSASAAIQDFSVWDTDYINGIGGFSIRVSPRPRCGDGTQSVTLTHDRNSCRFSELGLPQACTRMAPTRISAKLIYVPVAASRDIAVYQMAGTRYQIVTELNAESAPYSTPIRFLILAENGEVEQALSLRRDHNAAVPAIEPLPRNYRCVRPR